MWGAVVSLMIESVTWACSPSSRVEKRSRARSAVAYLAAFSSNSWAVIDTRNTASGSGIRRSNTSSTKRRTIETNRGFGSSDRSKLSPVSI
jgi:hypothetical protein